MRAEMLGATALRSRSSLQQVQLFGRERKAGMDHRLERTESSQNMEEDSVAGSGTKLSGNLSASETPNLGEM